MSASGASQGSGRDRGGDGGVATAAGERISVLERNCRRWGVQKGEDVEM